MEAGNHDQHSLVSGIFAYICILWWFNEISPFSPFGTKSSLKCYVCVCVCVCVCTLSRFIHVQLLETLWTSSSPGSSIHGILQARILEWVAMPSSRASYWPWVKPTSHTFCTVLYVTLIITTQKMSWNATSIIIIWIQDFTTLLSLILSII